MGPAAFLTTGIPTEAETRAHRDVIDEYVNRDAYVTKDSGARQTWDTGSQRDRATGKGLPSLIPTLALRRLAGLYERGAAKYDRHNWRKGQPLSSYIDSLLRHLWLVMDCQSEADGEDHCAAIIWNAIGIMWTLAAINAGALPAELDDRIGELDAA